MSSSPEKKRNKKRSPSGANNSFANLVANAANKQLADHVEQRMGQYAQAILQNLSKLTLDHLANIQTRHLAIEEIMIKSGTVSREQINNEITNQEDTALGYIEVDAAAEGDLVRVEVESKAADEAQYSEKEKLRINSLLREVDGAVQTLKEIETAMVGMKKDEIKDITIKGEGEDKDSNIRVTIKKVSRKKAEEKKDGTQA